VHIAIDGGDAGEKNLAQTNIGNAIISLRF
jgi:hypothetical protein